MPGLTLVGICALQGPEMLERLAGIYKHDADKVCRAKAGAYVLAMPHVQLMGPM